MLGQMKIYLLQVFEGSGGCLRSADPLVQQAGDEVSVPVPSLDGAQRGQALLQPPLDLLVCGEALGFVLQADLSRIECLGGELMDVDRVNE